MQITHKLRLLCCAVALACAPTMALHAATPQLIQSEAMAAKAASRTFIVQLREDPIASYSGTKPAQGAKIDPSAANVREYFAHLGRSHDRVLADVGASGDKVYSYCYAFNGFAAHLTNQQMLALEHHPEVVRIWNDELRQPQTNTSDDFLGLANGKGPWKHGFTGEDVVIGIIDTGVWPEHPSFADVKTPEKGSKGKKIPYGPPPANWNGTSCDFGNAAANPLDAEFECNNKLLGATHYVDGFLAASDLIDSEYVSARDNDGHGSHTGSTAGGNNGVEAQIAGEGLGKVTGMAPRARLAFYKICWNGSTPPTGFQNGCFASDSMAAIDQAVADGVDVINYSIGGASTSFGGPDDIAFLFAADAGVFVAASQGNSGPNAGTTGTPAGVPWLTSVGAMADDGVFNFGLDVNSADPGVSGVYESIEASFSVPITTVGTTTGDLIEIDDGTAPNNNGCEAAVNASAIAGNLALLQRGGCNFTTKVLNAQAAGALGVVVYNNDGDPITMGGAAPGITVPAVMISQGEGETIAASLAAGDAAAATMSPDIQIAKVNSTASFSSRGPNGGSPDIIKPDVTAPGVQILAAQTPTPNDGQAPGELFQEISGTSMSSPHVAGMGALLVQAFPDWTPAMIRSALMTTANPDLKKSFGDAVATPFDIGAGLVSPKDMFEPGLVYDAGFIDYLLYLCGSQEQRGIVPASLCAALGGGIDTSNLNLPSIGIAELVGVQTVSRTVTRVAGAKKANDGEVQNSNVKDRVFSAHVNAPAGIDVTVSPGTLSLAKGESATYNVSFSATTDAIQDVWAFGDVVWRASKHGHDENGEGDEDGHSKNAIAVRSPIAVKPVVASFPAEAFAADAGADGSLSFAVQSGFPGTITTNAGGLEPAFVQIGDVGIGDATLHFIEVLPGTRVARFSLFDESVGDGTGADDLDLQVQGPDTAGFPFVAFSGSATSEEEITLLDPEPGFYAVFVIHFATVNPVTPYDLHFWGAGPNNGNVTSSDPGAVNAGDTVSVDVDWTGLAPGTKYRGFVELNHNDSELGLTVLSVDTAP